MPAMIKTDVVVIGAGPCGIFQIFELGIHGLQVHVVETLAVAGGQCAELYPDKPIYDIPALPVCSAQELTDRLLEQVAPFNPVFHFNQEAVAITKNADGSWIVHTNAANSIQCKAVVIAAGVGAFQPVKLALDGIDAFTNTQLFYRIINPAAHHGKQLVVFGGGDSALDWALALAKHSFVTLVHRSNSFKAQQASIDAMQALCAADKMACVIGTAQGYTTNSAGKITAVILQSASGAQSIPCQHILCFYGLLPKIGAIEHWGLKIDKRKIVVDTEHFVSSSAGIYAVGDINTYPGKKKLILSGFHEAALVAFSIKQMLEPKKKVHLQYTTTSPAIQKRLGVYSDK